MIYNSILPYAIKENLRACNGIFSGGRQVARFESRLSEYTGKHVLLLDSGLSAIRVFLKSSGFSPGDEIAIPAYLCERVGTGLLSDGYRLNFIDVDDNYNISVADLQKKISPKTRGIIAAHFYGIPSDILSVMELAKQYDAVVIEDAAQSFGGRLNNKLLGTFGDCGVYSFGWFKPMTAMGGGALVSGSGKMIAAAGKTAVSNRGRKDGLVKLLKSLLYMNKRLYFKAVVDTYGSFGKSSNNAEYADADAGAGDAMVRDNGLYRMHDIQAGVGLVQIEKIDRFNEQRILNAKKIIAGLSGIPVAFPPGIPDCPVLRLPILLPGLGHADIRVLSEQLYKEGVEAPILYPFLPKYLGMDADCPNARFLSGHTLHLPVHPCLGDNDIDKIISTAKKRILQCYNTRLVSGRVGPETAFITENKG